MSMAPGRTTYAAANTQTVLQLAARYTGLAPGLALFFPFSRLVLVDRTRVGCSRPTISTCTLTRYEFDYEPHV